MPGLNQDLKILIESLSNVVLVEQDKISFHRMTDAFKDITFDYLDKATFLSKTKLLKTTSELETLNQETFDKGLLIHVPKNFISQETLHIIYLIDTKLTMQVQMDVDALATINVFEYIYSVFEDSLNLVVNIDILENASLTYTTLAEGPTLKASAITRNAYVKRYGRYVNTNAAFSNALTHQLSNVYLVGEYAYGISKTIALTSDKQEASFKTIVEHLAKTTEGYIEHYGVSNDASTLLFEGVGKIHKGMSRSIAKQSNKGVIIGDFARLDANPLLIIDEYDVEAGHGAAIGQIDADQLYYLMSRGLSKKDAERLIINGFLAPLNDVIKSDDLKDYVQKVLIMKTN
ncbi:MAG: SufD family Fe-S cluster assembly protein [Candidatus Izemoplasmataceae bacterium]